MVNTDRSPPCPAFVCRYLPWCTDHLEQLVLSFGEVDCVSCHYCVKDYGDKPNNHINRRRRRHSRLRPWNNLQLPHHIRRDLEPIYSMRKFELRVPKVNKTISFY